MNTDKMSLEYICTHLGEEDAANKYHGAVIPPLFATSLHVFNSIEDLLENNTNDGEKKYVYGRVDNPTVVLLEKKIAAIENADSAVCFASGMAAITSALLYAVKPGGHLICVQNVYGPTRTFIDNNLKEWGVSVTYVPGMTISDFERAVRPNTCAIYLESPTSAVMQLQDLTAVSSFARSRNLVTMIDNTWAAGVFQKPLDLGIDITIHTMSKYFGGHSDIIGGVLCASAPIAQKIRDSQRELHGGIIGPFEAWLVLRSLRSLSVRLTASEANALAVARFLENQPNVRRVNHPFVESFPHYELAKKQLSGSSGLFSIELSGTPEQSKVFVNALKLFRIGVSWGGFESLACMPLYKCSSEEAALRGSNRNLVRLYCGLENTAELIADLVHALSKAFG